MNVAKVLQLQPTLGDQHTYTNVRFHQTAICRLSPNSGHWVAE